MAKSYIPRLKRLLRKHGCRFERQGRGDHEIWYSPITDRRFVVDSAILSRDTAEQLVERHAARDVALAGADAVLG